MTKKIYLFLLFLCFVTLSITIKSQTVYDRQNDTLVMKEEDLVNFLKELAIGVKRENSAGVNRQYRHYPSMQSNQNQGYDALYQYRFDKIDRKLDNIMYLMGIRQTPSSGRDLIIDRYSSSSAPVYLGDYNYNDRQQIENINRLQRQVDLLEEQIKLLTNKSDDDSLKNQMNGISDELGKLREILIEQNKPFEQPSEPILPSEFLQPSEEEKEEPVTKDSIIVKNVLINNFDNYKRQLFFNVSSAQLTLESQNTLKGVAEILKQNPKLEVLIIGYASPEGNTSFNNALSEKRADSARKQLLSYGIPDSRISIRKAGEDSISEMKAYARRVDILLK